MIFFEMKTCVMSSQGFLRNQLESFTCPSFQTTVHQGQLQWHFEQPGQVGVLPVAAGLELDDL